MSATIRIKILGGTSIEDAFYDCLRVSGMLGGTGVETEFNGVELFYHGQTLETWLDDFYRDVRRFWANERERIDEWQRTAIPEGRK